MKFLEALTKKQRKTAKRIGVALLLFFVIYLIPLDDLLPQPWALYAEFVLFLVPYLLAGYDVLLRAVRGVVNGQVFDENFLMAIATVGAFGLVFFPDSDPHMAEGAAVMLFYQVGELFQDYAVGKSRRSIAQMMDIAPDHANVQRNGELIQVDPSEVQVGSIIVVKPGERVPLDGQVVSGSSQLDTAALTGESVPRQVGPGEGCISGCVNLTGVIQIKVTKPYDQSTVQRILELVENASEKKARTENFITRFARYYTPVVVIAALLLAVVPPLALGQSWSDWIQRGLIFLVVSCPCALVISVPLSFFGGIGGASRLGILVKGSNYLEALSKVDTVVFDKTGTLTSGSFAVSKICPAEDVSEGELVEQAALAEYYSDHPIALSVKRAYEDSASGESADERVAAAQEESGHGVRALVDGSEVLVGNAKLMARYGVAFQECDAIGTILHVSRDGAYLGHLIISDVVKPDAKHAIDALHAAGVTRTVMLTGDREEVARSVAAELGLDQHFSQLLPQQKVEHVERLLASKSADRNLAFVGDGINDAPVLMRADVGIAMGALGSDAAIEAADVVLMDDKPSNIARAIGISRKTMRIVWQNIVFAIGVKLLILALAALGVATLWLAVFGDVGVAVIAILNAMRAMRVSREGERA